MTNSIRVHVVRSYADRRDCGRSLNPSARDVDDGTLIDFQSNTKDSQLTSFWNIKFQYIIMDTRITLWRLDAKNFHIYIYPSSSFGNSELSTTRNFDYSKSLEEKKSWIQKNMSCQNVSSHFTWNTFKIRREKNNYFYEVTKRWRCHFCDFETHRWQWRFYLHVFQRTKEKTWRLVDCSERHIFLMIQETTYAKVQLCVLKNDRI